MNFDSFSEIAKASNKAKETLDLHNDKFDVLCKKSKDLINKFTYSNNPNKNDLKEATSLIKQALDIKKTVAEPYFYLACITYLINDIKLCVKYINIATILNPKLSGLDKLKEKIPSMNY